MQEKEVEELDLFYLQVIESMGLRENQSERKGVMAICSNIIG
jgi:hypothetical protein